jgi:hypothetical protein
MTFTKYQSDNLGAIASTLCLIHCVATPFLFIVQTSALTSFTETPTWWSFIDLFFLIISFWAVYQTTQTTSSSWMQPALWLSWFLLFILILNEKLTWFALNENLIYAPALALIILHLYNKKYCHCNTNKCCTNEE